MDADLVLGVATLLIGLVISIWMLRVRGGGVATLIGLLLVVTGLASVATSVIPKGPGKTAMLASFLIVSLVLLFLTIIRNVVTSRRGEPQDP